MAGGFTHGRWEHLGGFPEFGDFDLAAGGFVVAVESAAYSNSVGDDRALVIINNAFERAAGTIRADYAASIEENVVHGSDAAETAAVEIAYFFGDDGVCPRTR